MTLRRKIVTLATNLAFFYIILTPCDSTMIPLGGHNVSGCHSTHFECFHDCCLKEGWFCDDGQQRCRECDAGLCDRNDSLPLRCHLYCYKLLNPPASPRPSPDENQDSCVPWPVFLATVGTVGTALVVVVIVLAALCQCECRRRPFWKRVCQQCMGSQKQDPEVAEEDESIPLKAKEDTPRRDHACSSHRASLASKSSSDPSSNFEDLNLNPLNDEIRDDPQQATEGSSGDDSPQPSATPPGNTPGAGRGRGAGDTSGPGRLPPGGPGPERRAGSQDRAEGRSGAGHSPAMANYSSGEGRQTAPGQVDQAGDNGGRKAAAAAAAAAAGFEGGRGNRGSHGDIDIPRVHGPNDGDSRPSCSQQRDRPQPSGLPDNEVSTKPDFSQLPTVATGGDQGCVLATGTNNPARNYHVIQPSSSPIEDLSIA